MREGVRLLGAATLLDQLPALPPALLADLLIKLRPVPLRRHLAALPAGFPHRHSAFGRLLPRFVLRHSGYLVPPPELGDPTSSGQRMLAHYLTPRLPWANAGRAPVTRKHGSAGIPL